MTRKRPAKKAPAKAGVKLSDRSYVAYTFKDGTLHRQSAVDVLVTMIRQWSKLADSTDAEARLDAMNRLREVAAAANQAQLSLAFSSAGGKKGGTSPKERDPQATLPTKRGAIIAEAQDYTGKDSAKVATIARKTGATSQYVRKVLKETGN